MTPSADEGVALRSGPRLRVLELYAGIGGLAAALTPAAADVTTAVDVSRPALRVYTHNFGPARPSVQWSGVPRSGVPVVAAAVDSLPQRWPGWRADLWWMSPPCQPFTRRGQGRDVDDPRAASFLRVLDRIAAIRPPYVALENVPPFRGSRAHGRLLETLDGAGYRSLRETLLCPTELGIPNRRRRYYLVAGRGRLSAAEPRRRRSTRRARALAGYLDPAPPPSLAVDPELVARYEGALDVVRDDDPAAITACFTSAYGRSPVRSGSYLATAGGLRRFSPAEILRLLGFPPSFELPPELTLRNSWRLVGNSLSVAAVRTVLAAVPELASTILEPRCVAAEPLPPPKAFHQHDQALPRRTALPPLPGGGRDGLGEGGQGG